MDKIKVKENERIRDNLFEGVSPPDDVTVILWNDDTTNPIFVAFVLVIVFDYEITEAAETTQKAEERGKFPVGKYPEEIANMKISLAMLMAKEENYSDFKMTIE